MTKKELKVAFAETKRTRKPVRVGRWLLTTERVISHGIGYAWHWHYYWQPDELLSPLGGVTHVDTAADAILRSDRNGDTFSHYPAHCLRQPSAAL